MKRALLTLGLIFLYGCGTNPPNAVNQAVLDYGRISVAANVPAAQIFLDDVNTGRVTPDTIVTTVGTHSLRVEKTGFLPFSQSVFVIKDSTTSLFIPLQPTVQKVVLIEDFSNVSCVPCVASNLMLEQLTNRTYGRSKLVAVKYPTNFPSPNDLFYRANPGDANARINYYSVMIAPTMIVDGMAQFITSDSTAMKGSINPRLSLVPRFKITVTSSIAGGFYSTTVRVQALDTTGIDFSSLVLHVVVTETDIEFQTPPGSNGETRFYDVMRAMLPSNAGSPVSASLQPVDYPLQRAINAGWVAANLHTVAFIQNRQTKEVLQTASTF